MADTHQVILQPEAYEGMESAFTHIEQDSPERARAWAKGLMEAIDSLAIFPARCPLAPENDNFPQEIRQLLYGKGRQTYRILFTIKGDAVSILLIRHAAQQHLRPES